MHINVFVPSTGHHEASWLFHRAQPHRIGELSYYQEIAATAERGLLDSLFFGDQLALGRNVGHVADRRFEPLTLLAALAATTRHIGLIGTASTTYSEPYNLARQFASLDLLSGGRAGWNIVTSWSEDAALNFGQRARPGHADRYDRAEEFVDVVLRLWDSWEDDATVVDAPAGVFVDTRRVHAIDYVGHHFKVRGPLNVPRSPQGRPFLVQAGSSPVGRAFAARHAQAVFTAQQDLDEAVRFAQDIRRQAAALGRAPGSIRILPGLSPIIGETQAAAQALARELDDLTIPAVGLQYLSDRFDGFDFSGYPLDGPVPLEALPPPDAIQGHQSRSHIIRSLVAAEHLTLGGLLRRLAGGRGHRVLAGTPEQIAAHMTTWVQAGAADGFNVMPAYLPGGLDDFVDQVVPLLQRAGVFRTAYDGTTLHDHYGAARPVSRGAQARAPLAAG